MEDGRGVTFELSERLEVLVGAVQENHLVVAADSEDGDIFIKFDF